MTSIWCTVWPWLVDRPPRWVRLHYLCGCSFQQLSKDCRCRQLPGKLRDRRWCYFARWVCWAPCSRLECKYIQFTYWHVHFDLILLWTLTCLVLSNIDNNACHVDITMLYVTSNDIRNVTLYNSIKIVSTCLTQCTMLLVTYVNTHHSLTMAGDPDDKIGYYIESEYGFSASHCCMKQRKNM